MCFIGLYSSATISGAGVGLATSALAIYATVLVSTVIVLAAILGFHSLKGQVRRQQQTPLSGERLDGAAPGIPPDPRGTPCG